MTPVFLDASVLFSAALSPTGASRELLRLGFHGRIKPIISSFVVEEARRNLALKAPAALPALEAFLDAMPLVIAEPTMTDVRTAAQYTEPKDAPVVAAAVVADAVYLASHDHAHLVGNPSIEKATGLRIRTPGEVLQELRAAGQL